MIMLYLYHHKLTTEVLTHENEVSPFIYPAAIYLRQFSDHTLGAIDVILMLEELHRRGYERLRFFGYTSPNGMAYRVHIAHRDAMRENGYELEGDPIWYMAVGSNSCGVTPETLADEFLREYADHPDVNRAKAEDPEYVQWFARVADLARKGVYLSPYSEYRDSCLPRGFIYTIGDGEVRVPLPPLP